jgi:hypothetical protein
MTEDRQIIVKYSPSGNQWLATVEFDGEQVYETLGREIALVAQAASSYITARDSLVKAFIEARKS